MWGTVVLVRVLDWLHSGRRKLITSRVVWEGTSLVVQQLRLCALNAGGWGSILGWGTKIPCATQPKEKATTKATQRNKLSSPERN